MTFFSSPCFIGARRCFLLKSTGEKNRPLPHYGRHYSLKLIDHRQVPRLLDFVQPAAANAHGGEVF